MTPVPQLGPEAVVLSLSGVTAVAALEVSTGRFCLPTKCLLSHPRHVSRGAVGPARLHTSEPRFTGAQSKVPEVMLCHACPSIHVHAGAMQACPHPRT